MTIENEVLVQIGKDPGRTEAELARAIRGPQGYQQQVNQICRRLVQTGRVRREGMGGPGDPYKYYLK